MPGELGEVPLLLFYRRGHVLLEMLLFLPLLVADAYALHPNNLQVVLFSPHVHPYIDSARHPDLVTCPGNSP